MDQDPPAPSALHLTLERISSLFRAQLREQATARGLKLAQLEALIYLRVANRYSDTPTALAEYLGLTKGTTSQTLMALESQGLVRKVPDAADGRVLHCVLTGSGALLAEAALPAAALERLPATQQAAAQEAALQLLRALQAGHDFKTFGQCATCRHLQRHAATSRCGLTGDALTEGDTALICREHASP